MMKTVIFAVVLVSTSVLGQNWIQWPTAKGGNGHWYGLTRQAYRGWAQAEAEAQTYRHGHLVSINSLAEQAFLETVFLSGHSVSNAFWIGFNDFAQEGHWVWSTGESSAFAHWREGEPNNQYYSEDGAVLNWHFASGFGDFGTWNDFEENMRGNPDLPGYHGLVEVQSSEPPLFVEVDLASQTVPPKGMAVFRAWTYGLTGEVQYRWQFRGTDIASATNQTLVLTNVSRLQSGVYRVLVSGPGMDSLTSERAVLLVAGPPVIVAQPVSQVVTEGQDVEFSAAVDGEGPFNYEWRLNGTPLLNERQPILSLSNV